jgi:hypothetical protein
MWMKEEVVVTKKTLFSDLLLFYYTNLSNSESSFAVQLVTVYIISLLVTRYVSARWTVIYLAPFTSSDLRRV